MATCARRAEAAGHLALNRYGVVPTLAAWRLNLCQSNAILDYSPNTGQVQREPTPPGRARNREWLFWDFTAVARVFRSRAIARGILQAPEKAVAEAFRAAARPGRQRSNNARATELHHRRIPTAEDSAATWWSRWPTRAASTSRARQYPAWSKSMGRCPACAVTEVLRSRRARVAHRRWRFPTRPCGDRPLAGAGRLAGEGLVLLASPAARRLPSGSSSPTIEKNWPRQQLPGCRSDLCNGTTDATSPRPMDVDSPVEAIGDKAIRPARQRQGRRRSGPQPGNRSKSIYGIPHNRLGAVTTR